MQRPSLEVVSFRLQGSTPERARLRPQGRWPLVPARAATRLGSSRIRSWAGRPFPIPLRESTMAAKRRFRDLGKRCCRGGLDGLFFQGFCGANCHNKYVLHQGTPGNVRAIDDGFDPYQYFSEAARKVGSFPSHLRTQNHCRGSRRGFYVRLRGEAARAAAFSPLWTIVAQ